MRAYRGPLFLDQPASRPAGRPAKIHGPASRPAGRPRSTAQPAGRPADQRPSATTTTTTTWPAGRPLWPAGRPAAIWPAGRPAGREIAGRVARAVVMNQTHSNHNRPTSQSSDFVFDGSAAAVHFVSHRTHGGQATATETTAAEVGAPPAFETDDAGRRRLQYNSEAGTTRDLKSL